MTFLTVRYSTLVKIADQNKTWSKKTYNNSISILRRAFAFGYLNHPDKLNPACGLKCVRMSRKDRPIPDPFRIQNAEMLIAAIHGQWGEAQGNYDEFRFFTGMRPSEQIPLTVADLDTHAGTLSVNKARVAGIDRNSTNTGEDRRITLCPRALQILDRQLTLRDQMKRAGKIDHDHLFFQEDGQPIQHARYPYARWRQTLRKLPIRNRKPYGARHSSVSWNLMIGKNPLWVAKQHGHSVATMLRVYIAWMDSAPESDIAAIKDAMGMAPSPTLPAMNTTANSRILVKTARIAPALIAATSRLFEKIKESRLPIRIWHWIWHSKRSAAIQLTDLPTKSGWD